MRRRPWTFPNALGMTQEMVTEHNTMLNAIDKACRIIETGDERLLQSDGPAGGQPPELTLAEWRELYVTLDQARTL